jgi:Spy/CpxP family protein refolding chaperone
MQNKNYNKWWALLVVILVLVNIATLIFFWIGNKRESLPQRIIGNGGAEGFITKELHFDSSQKAAFFVIKKQHQESIKSTKEQIKTAKEAFFNLLKDSTTSEATVIATAEKISVLEKEIELKNFHHFQQLRAICINEQKLKFDSIIGRVVNMISPMQGPPPQIKGQHKGGKDGEFAPPPHDGQMPPRDGNMPPPDGEMPPPPPRNE